MNWHERYVRQAAWTHELRCYLFEKAGWSSAERVLEVGCGTGAILADQHAASHGSSGAPEMPAPLIHGLDLVPSALSECREHAPAAYLTCGSVLSLPYPAGAFDLTFCHFLLLWVPDPLQALLEMKRVTKRSGYVLALAEPNYTTRSDKPAELAWLGQQQNEALRRQGAALNLGSRLAELFYRAGMRLIETGPIRSPDSQALTAAAWESEWDVLEADLADAVPPLEIRRLKELDRQALGRTERILNVPTYFAWGQV